MTTRPIESKSSLGLFIDLFPFVISYFILCFSLYLCGEGMDPKHKP